LATQVGFDSQKGAGEAQALLRPVIVALAARAGDETAIGMCQESFDRFRRGEGTIEPDLRHVVFDVAMRGAENEASAISLMDYFIQLYHNASLPPDVRMSAMQSIGASTFPECARRALASILDKESKTVKMQDARFLIAAVGHGPCRRLVWPFLRHNWDELEGIYATGGSMGTLGHFVKGACHCLASRMEADDVLGFFRARGRVGRNMEYIAERILNNHLFVQRSDLATF
jgi:aminopeptidase N